MVGGALQRYFEQQQNLQLFLFDKGKNLGSIEEVNKAHIVFICVPTPYNETRGFDLSFVEESIGNLKGEKNVVIKSTVLPGTTEMLQKKYSQHTLFFNPEFLTESSAENDTLFPCRQIIGYTKKPNQNNLPIRSFDFLHEHRMKQPCQQQKLKW